MKNLILILILMFSISNCSNDKVENITTKSIIGKWKLEASVIGTGSKEIINQIENGQIIIFKNDDSFQIINSNIECVSGTYSIIENSKQHFNADVIYFYCNNNNSYMYSYFIENKKLFLTLLLEDGSSGCDEICAERYIKIDE
ncbi:MAG: hypothetical protein ACOH1N_14805 [Lutibacter sp.]